MMAWLYFFILWYILISIGSYVVLFMSTPTLTRYEVVIFAAIWPFTLAFMGIVAVVLLMKLFYNRPIRRD